MGFVGSLTNDPVLITREKERMIGLRLQKRTLGHRCLPGAGRIPKILLLRTRIQPLHSELTMSRPHLNP